MCLLEINDCGCDVLFFELTCIRFSEKQHSLTEFLYLNVRFIVVFMVWVWKKVFESCWDLWGSCVWSNITIKSWWARYRNWLGVVHKSRVVSILGGNGGVSHLFRCCSVFGKELKLVSRWQFNNKMIASKQQIRYFIYFVYHHRI